MAAFDDDTALRTLTALGDLGRRVPEDVVVIGFGETEYGSLSTTALTPCASTSRSSAAAPPGPRSASPPGPSPGGEAVPAATTPRGRRSGGGGG
ncbi:substrate-binding domain-containing protein [Streptomyces sp. 7R007]